MATITKDELQDILANAPEGTTATGIVDGLKSRGHTVEGYEEDKTTAKGVGNFLGGAVYGFSATGRTIQKGASKAVDAIAGTEGWGRPATKDEFEQQTGTDLDSTAGKAGNLAGEVAPYFAQPTKAIAKIPSAVSRLGARFGFNAGVGAVQEESLTEGAKIGAGGEAFVIGGKALQKVGAGLYKLALPINKREADLISDYMAQNNIWARVKSLFTGKGDKAPTLRGDTAFTKGLTGSQAQVGIQANRARRKVWSDLIAPTLKRTEARVSLNTMFDETREQIIKNYPETTRRNQLLKGLDAIRDDYKGQDIVTVEELQKLKEGWAENLPAKIFRGEDVAGSANTVRNMLRGNSREKILTVIDDPAIREAYIDYGNLVGLQEWGKVGITKSNFRAGSGGLVNALKDTVVIPVATVGGRTIYRTGTGIEFIGVAGAKTLHEVLNPDDIE